MGTSARRTQEAMKTCIHCGYAAPGEWAECPACGQLVPVGAERTGASPHPSYGPTGAAPGNVAYAPTLPSGQSAAPPPGAAPPSGGMATPGSAATGGPTPPPRAYPGYPPVPSPANPYASPSSDISGPVPYYNPAYEAMLPTSGKAIASLVLGILSIALIYFGLILGPLAIGFWASARKDLEEMPPRFKGKGMNTAGLVTGIIGTIIGVLIVAGIAFAVCAAERASNTSF